jgi:membrane protein DedA with SNARE-associated domain
MVFLSLMFGTLVSEDLASITAGLLIREGAIGAIAAVVACSIGILAGDIGLWAGRVGLPASAARRGAGTGSWSVVRAVTTGNEIRGTVAPGAVR